MWTAKEAYLKLTGEGLRGDPRGIALELHRGHPIAFKGLNEDVILARVPLHEPRAICHLVWARTVGTGSAEPPPLTGLPRPHPYVPVDVASIPNPDPPFVCRAP